ncbi:MAG: glycine cleavage system aminomethyltransferase GcvT [Fimbriimonadaceae bacterium]|nr:glycine cleavage system aminomethyltransferase GcvT [Fimbriimonadaceae bacterium]
MSSETVLRTPLFDAHVAAGGRMVPFAGYEMPVQYTGVIAEAKAVRESAGMFDVSHMARLWFRGERTLEFLEWITTNDVAKLEDGRGQYSLLPNERGGVVDDIIVYRVDEHVYRMVVNAANHAKDVAWISSHNAFDVAIEDETDRTAMIAVQGPRAVEILASMCNRPDSLREAPLFGLNDVTIAGIACFAPRSGYTGEDGFELICAVHDAQRLWDALLEAGVTPCGLGSRDTLRVEAGLPLYGHELTDDTNPISTGLGWVVGKTKSFLGCEPIQTARAEGTATKLHGVRLESKRLPMPEMGVFVDGAQVGAVTSGVYSPTLECGIGFAYVDAGVKLGTPITVDIRGKHEPGTLVSKRFLK